MMPRQDFTLSEKFIKKLTTGDIHCLCERLNKVCNVRMEKPWCAGAWERAQQISP